MTKRKFKNGERVQIIGGSYSGNPTGEIYKYSRNLDAYNIKGDDGYNYNCILENEIKVLEESNSEVAITVEPQEDTYQETYNEFSKLSFDIDDLEAKKQALQDKLIDLKIKEYVSFAKESGGTIDVSRFEYYLKTIIRDVKNILSK
ncbi:hypothetical protein ACU3L3_06980 [Priestia endophytica]